MALPRARQRLTASLVAVTLLLAVLQLTGGVSSGLRAIANTVVSPFAAVIDTVAKPIGHLFAGVINYSDVVAQNQRLRYQLGQAELQLRETKGLARRAEELSAASQVPFVGNLPVVAASVTTLSPTNFAATFDIAKGRDDGVLAGMPVVANGGLVGRVVSTTPHGATVRLITDQHSILGATFGVKEPSVLVTGRGVDGGLASTAVPLSADITPGTQLFTDGLQGGLFPEGLPVAMVTKVRLTPGAATYDLTLSPVADLKNLAIVDVVIWEPST